MERFDDTAIESMLHELRPAPDPKFVAELDAWAAAGCPPRSRHRRLLTAALGERLRIPRPRSIAFAGGVTALLAIVVATMLVSSTDSGSPARRAVDRSDGGSLLNGWSDGGNLLNGFSGSAPSSAHSEGASAVEAQASSGHRSIERSARVTLIADPEDVADDSAQVFAAVHDANGIVLRSNTTQGPAGRAGATFDLLIPSARLGDVLAAISAIDEVLSRHDATEDITAPTVTVQQHLRDSRARIDSLLSQLALAETETEREALEAELRSERRQAAALEAQLAHLHRRTHYSHVSVRIETGDSPASSGGTWGFDNAIGSAGHILTVAAGVTLIGLAVLAPIAILALLAWLAHRIWLRIRRERALS